MRNNPDANIRTNFAIDEVVKPRHMNALAESIQYDYVVTADMLDGKSGNVNVDELLGGNKIHGIASGTFHVLINVIIPDTITLVFPDGSVGGPSGDVRIHVHTIAPFKAIIGNNGSPYFRFYFHTHGSAEAVTIVSMAAKRVWVGAFIMTEPLDIGNALSFIYEDALDKIPISLTASIARSAWMSNGVGADNMLYIFDTVSKYNQGKQRLVMSVGDEIIGQVIGQDLKVGPRRNISEYQSVPGFSGYERSSEIDMSNISGIDWTTWQSAPTMEYLIPGTSVSFWDVYNPYQLLALNTKMMPIGKVYAIRIHAAKNKHDGQDVFVEANINTSNLGETSYTFMREIGTTPSPITGSFVEGYAPNPGKFAADGIQTGNITIQTANGYYSGALPGTIEATDDVYVLSFGDITSDAIVFRSSDTECPEATDFPNIINATFTPKMNGELLCEFVAQSRGGGSALHYSLTCAQPIIDAVQADITYTIPVKEWRERVYSIQENSVDYSYVQDAGPRLLAPKDGPRFYWPYMLDDSSYEGVGASELAPKFHPVNTDPPSEAFPPNPGADPENEYAYDVPSPEYEAVVYMCRIDQDHVLVLGY